MERASRPVRSLTTRRRHARGQSLVEFAVVFPVMMALLLGIADFARWYTTAVAVESAAREAADFGAFSNANWTTTPVDNVPTTVAEMKRRACTAASSLGDYAEPAGTVGHADCTNPSFAYDPMAGDCGDPAKEPPCDVHVTLTYTFHLFFGVPPLPASITFTRDSTFAVSALPSS